MEDIEIPPGIHFGLSDADYHGLFALSSSGIKNLRISPLDFWARSKLNPEYEDSDTEALKVGRAYDKRIIEGKAVFDALYAPSITPGDGMLVTNDDLKAELARRELKIGGNKAELIARLLEDDPTIRARLWELVKADYEAAHDGKEFLPADLIKKIEYAAAFIEMHPQLSKAFTGGYPQVSIIWRDEESGVPCKARLDYLKRKAVVDLKTVEDSLGIPLKKAFARSIATYKYHIQARLYLDAVKIAQGFIRESRVFGEVDKPFLQGVCACDDHQWLWVVQRKGIAPLAQGFTLPSGLTLDLAKSEIDQAMATFKHCWETFGRDPWLVPTEIEAYDSVDFPVWIAD